MNKIFTELDHRLSVVKRWGILHTIQQQSVAEHAFNVERIAVRIAKQWFNINDPAMLFRVGQLAHHHDDFEALTGDLPSMVKPYFKEFEFEADHSDLILIRTDTSHTLYNVVKLADMLEGWHFLCVEDNLGNSYAANHYFHEPNRIMEFVAKTWPRDDRIQSLVVTVIEEFRGEISIRHSKRGR